MDINLEVSLKLFCLHACGTKACRVEGQSPSSPSAEGDQRTLSSGHLPLLKKWTKLLYFPYIKKSPFFCRHLPGTAACGVKGTGRGSAFYWEKISSVSECSQFFLFGQGFSFSKKRKSLCVLCFVSCTSKK